MIQKITAPKGEYLTQSAEVDITERVYVTKVSGASETLDADWRTATAEEKSEHDISVNKL